MRKRTMLIVIDKLMWLFILLLPVIAYFLQPLGYSIGGGTALSGLSGNAINMPTFADLLSQFGINGDNIVYTSLQDLFGSDGIIHLFYTDSALLLYFSYFISVELVHLAIDFLLFIPRLAQKWLHILTKDGDE